MRSAILCRVVATAVACLLMGCAAMAQPSSIPPAEIAQPGAGKGAVCGSASRYACNPGLFCTSQGMGEDATEGICCASNEVPFPSGVRTEGLLTRIIWTCALPRPTTKPKPNPCPRGFDLVNGQCKRKPATKPVANPPSCPEGQHRQGLRCVADRTKKGDPETLCKGRGGRWGKTAQFDTAGQRLADRGACDTESMCVKGAGARPNTFECLSAQGLDPACCDVGSVCHPEEPNNNGPKCRAK